MCFFGDFSGLIYGAKVWGFRFSHSGGKDFRAIGLVEFYDGFCLEGRCGKLWASNPHLQVSFFEMWISYWALKNA